jgi:hypothetical protein
LGYYEDRFICVEEIKMKVHESNLRILSKLKKSLSPDMINKYKDDGINIEMEDGNFAYTEVQESKDAIEILKLFNENKAGDIDILFSKRFEIEMENEKEEKLYDKQLFEPKFEAVRFCVSKITFFVEKEEMYSVDMDYDFKHSITISINKFLSEEKKAQLFFKETPWILKDILNGIKGNKLDE